MIAFGVKKRKKANINENIETCTENIRDKYGKLQFPPQFQLFFQNTYSDQIFFRFRTAWNIINAFCAKKREKANINENIETCTENLRDIYGKLQFPPQFQLFFQNTYSDQIFFRVRIAWNIINAFCAKKREKANVNENIETLNFRVICAKLQIPQKSNFSSKTFFLTKSFINSELVGLVWLRLAPKREKTQTSTKTLRLVRKILETYMANCNFHHNSNFFSKTLILTKSFSESELLGIL